jgi:predicted transglutaminase-like cysteine proteinase
MTATPSGWYTAQRFVELQQTQKALADASYDDDPEHLLVWRADVAGNCLGKSLWAWKRLLSLGWPGDAFSLWECRTEDGKKHMILAASVGLEEGPQDVALDCRQQTPMIRDQLGYTEWLRLEPREDLPERPAP